MAFPAVITLKRIEYRRLRALVLEDLARYPRSAFGEVHARIGTEIPARRLRTLLRQLVEMQVLQKSGNLKGDAVPVGSARFIDRTDAESSPFRSISCQ